MKDKQMNEGTPPLVGWLPYITNALRSLTPKGVSLFLVLASSLGIGVAVWEQRTTLLPLYLSSTAGVVATGVAVVLVLLALVLMDMYSRLEARAEKAMQLHVSQLQVQISLQTENIRLQAMRIVELQNEHTLCQRQLIDMHIILAKAGIK